METTPIQSVIYKIYTYSLNHVIIDSIEHVTRSIYESARRYISAGDYHSFRMCLLTAISQDTPLPDDISYAVDVYFSNVYNAKDAMKKAPQYAENAIRRESKTLCERLDKIEKQYSKFVSMLGKNTFSSHIDKVKELDRYFGVISPDTPKCFKLAYFFTFGFIEGKRAERKRRNRK